MTTFDPVILTLDDLETAIRYVGDRLTHPDLVIAPAGAPYLYRWHVVPRNEQANIYFHIQVKSDPGLPLHDHPWDNTTIVLAGSYTELFEPVPELVAPEFYDRWLPISRPLKAGKMVSRPAKMAHRLLLPLSIPYAMTLFITGPKVREWGFWYKDGFHDHRQHVLETVDGLSVGSHW